MVYRQTHKIIESGFGEVTIYLNFSETLSDLLDMTAGNVTAIDFIEIENLTKKVDLDKGEITSELKFSFDSQDLRGFSGFATFIFNNSIYKYCSVVFNSLTAQNIVFVGVVQDEHEKDDYVWNSSLGATTLNEECKYSMTAKPYSEVITNITLESILDEIKDDTDWQSYFVANRKGYYYESISGSIYEVRALELVQLEHAILKIFEVLRAKLDDAGLPITFKFNDVRLPFDIHPARFQLYVHDFEVTRLVKGATGWDGEPIKIFGDDYYGARVWLESPEINTSPIFINARLLFPKVREPNAKLAEKDNWKNQKDVIQLLQKIAMALGVFIQYEFTAVSELEVRFVAPRDFLSESYVYFADAVSSKLQVTTGEIQEEGFGIARANYLASEGHSYYKRSYNVRDGQRFSYENIGDVPDSNLLPISISPTLAAGDGITHIYLDETGRTVFADASLPHNYGLFKNNVCNFPDKAAEGITTAMFIPVGDYADNPYHPYEPQTDAFYLPAAAIRCIVDGEEKTYKTISDYVEDGNKFKVKHYVFERSLELPIICGFSNTLDLSVKKWDALQLGRKLLVNGSDYIITEIEYNFNELKTSIKANTNKLFAFEPPTGAASADLTEAVASFADNNIKQEKQVSVAIAYNYIGNGEAVAMRSDGLCERATATNTHAGKIIGIAMNEANVGALCFIQKTGEATTPPSFADLTPGQIIYLRTNNASQPNINTTALTTATAEEDLYCILGVATAANMFMIKIIDYIFE